jgi:thioredoxin-related protein/YHS domain-containing protein
MNTPQFGCRLGLLVVLTAVFVCFQIVSGLTQGIPGALPPGGAINWETDLSTAMARAEREQRPLFLHFVGNEVSSAQQMERDVFTLPNIATHLNTNFVMVKINATENPTLAQKYAVTEIPTDFIMKSNGEPVHRRRGVIPADKFAQYLAYLQDTMQSGRSQPSVPSTVTPDTPPTNVIVGFTTNPHLATSHSPPSGIPSTAISVSGTTPPPITPPSAMSPPNVVVFPNAVPNAADPFATHLTGVQPPPNVQPPPSIQPTGVLPMVTGGMPTPPNSNNPLRANEPSARPTMDYAVTPSVSPAVSPTTLSPNPAILNPVVPPVAASESSITAMLAEKPAPAKMTVEVPLALEGYCPFMLCKTESWVSGNPVYCTLYQGHIFRFSSMEALVTFAQDPANCIPVAMGEDIVLMVDRNKRVNGDRDFAAYFKGRVFLFSSQETFDAFRARPDFYTEIALKYEMARREQALPVVY